MRCFKLGHYCKDVCTSGKYDTSSNHGRPKYLKNTAVKIKKCSVCSRRFYNLPDDMVYCPCCGLQLRRRTTYIKYKKIKKQEQMANRIPITVKTAEGYEILLMVEG